MIGSVTMCSVFLCGYYSLRIPLQCLLQSVELIVKSTIYRTSIYFFLISITITGQHRCSLFPENTSHNKTLIAISLIASFYFLRIVTINLTEALPIKDSLLNICLKDIRHLKQRTSNKCYLRRYTLWIGFNIC